MNKKFAAYGCQMPFVDALRVGRVEGCGNLRSSRRKRICFNTFQIPCSGACAHSLAWWRVFCLGLFSPYSIRNARVHKEKRESEGNFPLGQLQPHIICRECGVLPAGAMAGPYCLIWQAFCIARGPDDPHPCSGK